ncbi:MAG: hypothetical protein ACJ72F_03355 [Nitrososphaeraceae archaeon]
MSECSSESLLTHENSRLGIKIVSITGNYMKRVYPDHPDEQWSQVIGLVSPTEINTGSKLENSRSLSFTSFSCSLPAFC